MAMRTVSCTYVPQALPYETFGRTENWDVALERVDKDTLGPPYNSLERRVCIVWTLLTCRGRPVQMHALRASTELRLSLQTPAAVGGVPPVLHTSAAPFHPGEKSCLYSKS